MSALPARFRVRSWLAILLGCGIWGGPAWPQEPPPDPLQQFLRGMSDSTNVYFGRTAVQFDTTGLDSLILAGGDPKLKKGRGAGGGASRRPGVSYSPIVRFHRAEGQVLGLGLTVGSRPLGWFETKGAYGLASKEGRYDIRYARTIFRPLVDGELADTRLDLELAYARATLPFAPEHAEPFVSQVGAELTGLDGQSIFERRGLSGGLRLRASGFDLRAGYRQARDHSMPRATRWSLWGARGKVKEVTPASDGFFQEGYGGLTWRRPEQEFHTGLWGSYASPDRWRLRTALAQAARLGPWVKLLTQTEAGLAARGGPSQDRFELGGANAVASLGFGRFSGNRLLAERLELVGGVDFLKAVHLPHLRWLVLYPALFGHAGAVWTSNQAGEMVPRDSWRGAAGVSLINLPGGTTTYVRLQYAWPVGRESGVPRLSISLGNWFDLVPEP